jgi:subtilisin family serine protease
MTEPQQSREQAQIQLILDEFGDVCEVYPPDWRSAEGGAQFISRANYMLVRDRDLDRVRALFGDERRIPPDDGTINGLTRYELPPDFAFGDDEPRANSDLPRTMRHIAYVDAKLGAGVVSPDHLVFVVPVSPCPADEPHSVPESTPPTPHVPRSHFDGRGVKVVVVDVGWTPHPAPWLAGVTGDVEQAYNSSGNIKSYAGHGTFIAGVLRMVAPKAEVVVKGVFTRAGASWESDLVKKLDEALDESPDLISLSAGTFTRNLLSSMGFDVFFEERLSKVKGLLMVCAAGNEHTRAPFFPAASPGTLSVGALSADRHHRADYTNFGGWVDVYAPGTDLINAYLNGVFICTEPPNVGEHRKFEGMARWSGTSFSTPLVAGLVAARMSGTGQNAQEAAADLVKFAQSQAIHGVGAVLLPDQAGC